MDKEFHIVSIRNQRISNEEIVPLEVSEEEYAQIIARYGNGEKTIRVQNEDDFRKAQEKALPGEELLKFYRSTPWTGTFEHGIVAFARWFTMMQEAALKYGKFRAVVNYDAEKTRTEMYVYTPKESGGDDISQED